MALGFGSGPGCCMILRTLPFFCSDGSGRKPWITLYNRLELRLGMICPGYLNQTHRYNGRPNYRYMW